MGTDRSKARRPKTPEPEGAGLVALVDAWLTFAAQVADFTGDFDVYLLALDGRSMCQRAMREATRETAVRLGMSVAVGDGRYRRRTKPDDRGLLLPHTPWDCSEWWWRRVPLRGPALRWLEDGEVRVGRRTGSRLGAVLRCHPAIPSVRGRRRWSCDDVLRRRGRHR